MDLKTRIRRRQRPGSTAALVVDYDAISPVAHLEEPTGRGPVLERLLDYLDPVFQGSLPPNASLWGPAGSGKSAVVTALVTHLDRLCGRSGSTIQTTTRARSDTMPAFVYVDGRRAESETSLYHAVLDGLAEESIPKQGVGTEALRSRLQDRLRPPGEIAVVVVDHVGEPETPSLDDLADAFDPVSDALSWLAVGRTDPATDSSAPPERIEVPAYDHHALVDVLTARASEGLAQHGVSHEQVRHLADWADGDAHDALAALFGAADTASRARHDRIQERDLDAGMAGVPRPSVALGRVMTLPANRQLVLRTLLDVDEAAAESVGAAAEAIAADPAVDLSAGTVRRFLYELSEVGILDRVTAPDAADGAGRPPSRLEPRFPTLVFRRLYELQSE
ncbi:Cdc6/Cdc18 family protein [Haloarchaeobius sp. TZWWS8]|uniref:Cdc6/Cdc18 family protein n=1 Tax=Haloarchaeobius sp. TZWWS8 TaxID=3446121 RepID=UPI003EB80383